MSATETRDEAAWHSGQSGFTLIEVLAAVAIMAVAMSVVAFAIGRRPDRDPAATAAMETASRLRATRDAAIRFGGEETLLVDVARRVVQGRGRPVSLLPDLAVDAFVADTERRGASVAGIRFFANGASTGGVIRYEHSGRSYEVRVNWLTGRVSITPPP